MKLTGRFNRARLVVVSTVVIASLFTLAGCAGPLNAGSPPAIPFSISVSPGAQTVKAGQGAEYTVTVNPAAMAGAVNLSTSPLPPGVTGTFGAYIDVLAGQKKLFLFTTEDTPPTSLPITITATDPLSGHMHTTSANVTITPAADFKLSATPMTQNLKPGGTTSYTVNVVPSSVVSTTVALSAQNLPAGVTASFSPTTITGAGSSTVTVAADASASTTQASFLIVGTDASGSYNVPVYLDIAPADFSVTAAASPIEIQAGGTFQSSVDVQGLFGATPGTVAFTAMGLPPGASASFAPASVTGSGPTTMTITTDTSALSGTYTLTIQGTDASGTNSAQIPLVIATGTAGVDAYLAVSPVVENITSGGTATFTVELSGPGANSSVPLSASADQGGVSASLKAMGQPGLYQLNVTTDSSLILSGTATVTVTATTATGNQTIQVQLQISPPPPTP